MMPIAGPSFYAASSGWTREIPVQPGYYFVSRDRTLGVEVLWCERAPGEEQDGAYWIVADEEHYTASELRSRGFLFTTNPIPLPACP